VATPLHSTFLMYFDEMMRQHKEVEVEMPEEIHRVEVRLLCLHYE
jgi:hypothetical protein